jgi:hypothetical protein
VAVQVAAAVVVQLAAAVVVQVASEAEMDLMLVLYNKYIFLKNSVLSNFFRFFYSLSMPHYKLLL